MAGHVIIDGNNLLFAMRDHAPLPQVGRETLVRLIDRWARRGGDDVTLVFDGAAPLGGLGKQMISSRIMVRFSAPATADDVIVRLIHQAKHPETIRVITRDTAIRKEAAHRRCQRGDTVAFVHELCGSPPPRSVSSGAPEEKPTQVTEDDVDAWLELFADEDDDVFEGR